MNRIIPGDIAPLTGAQVTAVLHCDPDVLGMVPQNAPAQQLVGMMRRQLATKALLLTFSFRAEGSIHRAGTISVQQLADSVEKLETQSQELWSSIHCSGTADELALFFATDFGSVLVRLRSIPGRVIVRMPHIFTVAGVQTVLPLFDGVILVLTCGETRWESAMQIKQQLDAAHIRVLGAILDKRKFYVPQWIYNRL
jgi:hypothetical protein